MQFTNVHGQLNNNFYQDIACKNQILVIIVIAVISLFSTNVYSQEKSSNLSPDSFYQNLNDLSFVNESNQPFIVQDLSGKVVLVNFIFTNCSWVCPMQTAKLVKVFKQFPPSIIENVHFVSISIDPKRDDPEELKQFSETMKANFAQWSFLSADVDDTQTLIDRLSLVSNKSIDGDSQIDHTTNLWLISKSGHLMMRYDGLNIDHERLIREVSQLVSL